MCPFPSCICFFYVSSICNFCLFSTCILLSHFFCNCHVCLFQICIFQFHVFCIVSPFFQNANILEQAQFDSTTLMINGSKNCLFQKLNRFNTSIFPAALQGWQIATACLLLVRKLMMMLQGQTLLFFIFLYMRGVGSTTLVRRLGRLGGRYGSVFSSILARLQKSHVDRPGFAIVTTKLQQLFLAGWIGRKYRLGTGHWVRMVTRKFHQDTVERLLQYCRGQLQVRCLFSRSSDCACCYTVCEKLKNPLLIPKPR